MNKNGIWKKFSETKPDLNKKILLFRIRREKYTIASLQICNDLEEGEKEYWVTENGSGHDPEADDAWIEFLPYSTSKEYK